MTNNEPAINHPELLAMMETRSYMQLDLAEEDCVQFSTRDNGDVGECEHGAADIAHAREMRTEILAAFSTAKVQIDTCDEWVNLIISFPVTTR